MFRLSCSPIPRAARDAREMFSKVPVPVMAVHSSEEWKLSASTHAACGFIRRRHPRHGIQAAGERLVCGSYRHPECEYNPGRRGGYPSGADADVMATKPAQSRARNAIVTFTAPRPAHVFGELSTGPTYVAPIGSPDEAISSSLG